MATLADRLDHVLGVKAAEQLQEHFDMHSVEDLLRHYPSRYATQGQALTEEAPEEGQHITVIGRVTKTDLRPMKNRRGSLLKVNLDTGDARPVEITFFNGDKVRYLVKEGARAMMSGTVHWWRPDRWNLSHPDYLILPDKEEGTIENLTSVRGGGALRGLAQSAKGAAWRGCLVLRARVHPGLSVDGEGAELGSAALYPPGARSARPHRRPAARAAAHRA